MWDAGLQAQMDQSIPELGFTCIALRKGKTRLLWNTCRGNIVWVRLGGVSPRCFVSQLFLGCPNSKRGSEQYCFFM